MHTDKFFSQPFSVQQPGRSPIARHGDRWFSFLFISYVNAQSEQEIYICGLWTDQVHISVFIRRILRSGQALLRLT
jgi:hypothetical protein